MVLSKYFGVPRPASPSPSFDPMSESFVQGGLAAQRLSDKTAYDTTIEEIWSWLAGAHAALVDTLCGVYFPRVDAEAPDRLRKEILGELAHIVTMACTCTINDPRIWLVEPDGRLVLEDSPQHDRMRAMLASSNLFERLHQAERLSSIGQLASGIAHEVGTPLNIISGRAEMVLGSLPADHPAREDLQIVVVRPSCVTRNRYPTIASSCAKLSNRPRSNSVPDSVRIWLRTRLSDQPPIRRSSFSSCSGSHASRPAFPTASRTLRCSSSVASTIGGSRSAMYSRAYASWIPNVRLNPSGNFSRSATARGTLKRPCGVSLAFPGSLFSSRQSPSRRASILLAAVAGAFLPLLPRARFERMG